MLCGAAVGAERQWSGHATGPQSHFAGIRTFTLLGGLSGTIGFLWVNGFQALATVLLIGAIGIVLIAYAAISRRDSDATTETGALIVLAAGVLAGLGSWKLASGMSAITALLLFEKSRIHRLITEIPDVGIRTGFRFAIMALVILPLLPQGPYGPLGGIRPRELWLLVLFFSGLSFLAYIVRSFVGPGRGYVVAGLLGGLISSTSVTFTFSKLSRSDEKSSTPLALGVLAACTMMYLRVNAAAAALNPRLGLALAPYMLVPAAVGAAFILWGFRRATKDQQETGETKNPLQLRAAIQMAVLFQIVLFAVTAVRQRWGQTGLILSGAILGFSDTDALVISMAKAAREQDQIHAATLSTVVGTLSNTALKLGLAAFLGGGRFRTLVVGGLIVLAAVSALVLLALR
jgi:uncharacterized membrane protein (DUF4010 family)